MFIVRSMVLNMVLATGRGISQWKFAMLWLVSYVFLLRMPSEALPMARGGEAGDEDVQSVLCLRKGILYLKLKRRKNRPRGSLLSRACTCAASERLCPIHVLWHGFFKDLPVGAQPWAEVSPGDARREIRSVLEVLQVHDAEKYGTHDFRRGHAKVEDRISSSYTVVACILFMSRTCRMLAFH